MLVNIEENTCVFTSLRGLSQLEYQSFDARSNPVKQPFTGLLRSSRLRFSNISRARNDGAELCA